MEGEPTCGKGLAEHSAVPARIADLMAAVAENLELHMRALDERDASSGRELDAYRALASEHRELAARLHGTAEQMASYRTLAMGPHDMAAISTPEVLEAFETFVKREEALLALLRERLERDRAMLREMGA